MQGPRNHIEITDTAQKTTDMVMTPDSEYAVPPISAKVIKGEHNIYAPETIACTLSPKQ